MAGLLISRSLSSTPMTVSTPIQQIVEFQDDNNTEDSSPIIDLVSLQSADDILSVGLRHRLPLSEMERLFRHFIETQSGMMISPTASHDSRSNDELLVTHRFESFLLRMAETIPSPSTTAKTVTRILSLLSFVPQSYTARDKLAKQCVKFAVARPNAFDPTTFTECVSFVARVGAADVQFVEFIRSEALLLMPEFGPTELATLLEAFNVMKLYNRELIDLLVERMSEEIDRYTPVDIARTLDVIASMGLVRMHITRQLASLALKNQEQFLVGELVSIVSSLARLRWIKAADFLPVVAAAVKEKEFIAVEGKNLYEVREKKRKRDYLNSELSNLGALQSSCTAFRISIP